MSAVLFLMGPTAAGKTAAAMDLVEQFPFDIVSVDSALVYRGLDIGTAKPSAAELARAPHRLIDIVDPDERYSAGRFRRDAQAAVTDIRATGRVPLLVGGTLLYFRAYSHGLARLPESKPEIRAELDARAARLGWPALHAELAATDPDAASRIHPNDAQRIQRALEVYRVTGQTISTLQRSSQRPNSGETIYRVAWCPPREALYANCARRLNSMIENGFIDELRGLHRRGDLTSSHPAIRAVGYRQFWQHLDGELSFDAAASQALVATRRLVKRQLTWLRAMPGVVWIDPASPNSADRLAQVANRVVRAASD